jgi:hypothetical protein
MKRSDHRVRSRVALGVSAAALVVTVLGVTPLGSAAGSSAGPKAQGGDSSTARSGQTANRPLANSTPSAKRGPRGPRGRRGLRGLRGPAGPAGTQGPAGPAGPAGATNVTSASFAFSASPEVGAWAWRACPAGSRATGGGVRSDNTNISVYESYPVNTGGAPLADGETPAGWKVGVYNYAAVELPFTVYVICSAP